MKKTLDFLRNRFSQGSTWAGFAAATATIPELQYLTAFCAAMAVVLN